jgi:hypothetical protein
MAKKRSNNLAAARDGNMTMNNLPRISVHVGTNFQKERSKRRNTEDLFKDYSEKVLAAGYRAYLRGDRLDGRHFQDYMERSRRNRKPEPENMCTTHGGQAVHKKGSPSRLRRLEGRHNWMLTLRENVSRFVLSVCRMDQNVRRRQDLKMRG